MRLFIAIALSEEVKQRALAARKMLQPAKTDVKWVEYENYHITLKFLGETMPEKLDKIRQGLLWASGRCGTFELECGGIGFFPNQRRPRVVWMGTGGEINRAETLGRNIDNALADLGFEPEKKRSFHLTLGRIRSERNTEDLTALAMSLAKNIGPVKIRVADFHLMESRLSPAGPQYQILQSFALKRA